MSDYQQARGESSAAAPSAAPAKSAYENKRSEVNELRQLLRAPEVQRDAKRYREVVEKVILYMTLGIDVSRLFSEMVMASATQNLVQKKLIYLYLCNYAESHSELALLTVNTLQKDCRDANPMIRGLALRAICNLRVANLVEYVMASLIAGLSDQSPYVRKAAVMGCVKIFYLAPSAIQDNNVADTLYGMLQDRDPQVVANCVIALEEILAEDGGILLTRDIAYTLLNRLKDFTDWNQCAIMAVLIRYTPSDEDEVFDLLNLLDERLKHSNTGVVLAACRLFLHLTRDMPDMRDDLYERLKTPLITFMSSASAEVAFAVVPHVHLLIRRAPHLFASEYKAFFCRVSEPSYLKFKKLDMMTDVANSANVKNIVEELAAYVTDIDVEIARRAVRSVGHIACKVVDAREHCISVLLAFLELHIDYVTAETLVVMRDVLRLIPEEGEELVPQIFELLEQDSIDSAPEARAALVWFLGEYGHVLERAPYILEPMIDAVGTEMSPAVRLQLLTSTVKLFFKRPPEVQRMMGRLLSSIIADDMNMDVHDRALLYYRLITTDLEEAKRVICAAAPRVDAFAEFAFADDTQLFKEFNTLAVIYNQPSVNFIAQMAPFNLIGQLHSGEPRRKEADSSRRGTEEGQLIDSAPANFTPNPNLALVPRPNLPPAEFERMWMTAEMSAVVKDVLHTVPTASTTNDISKALAAVGIVLMASSPPQNNTIKFFFYAQEARNASAFHLIEATLELASRTISAMIKSTQPDKAPVLATILRQALNAAHLITMDLI